MICTDRSTNRSNKITHVALVADGNTIVHARSSKYGVCTNDIDLYSGKICAVVRYNPSVPLRMGMCGWRTLALQQALNANGAALSEDGEFGERTRDAVIACQQSLGLEGTGIADTALLDRLQRIEPTPPPVPDTNCVEVTGNTVNVRTGPGTDYESVFIARKGERYPTVDPQGWTPIRHEGKLYWISDRYLR